MNETPMDDTGEYIEGIKADDHSSITVYIRKFFDNSANKPLPWVALCCLATGLCVGYVQSISNEARRQHEELERMKTHEMLMDDAYQRWKMYAEAHGFPEPEKHK